jgi:hypothetical protein
MKLAPWSPAPKNAPRLSPPVNADEERWWLQKRKALRLRVMVQFGVPQFAAYVLGFGLKDPARLFQPKSLILVPIFGLLAWAGSWVMWGGMEAHQRAQEVRWRRIRERLLAESTVAESDR